MPGTSEPSLRASPPGRPDILDALRTATAALHAEVDQCLPLAQPSPDLADYRAHLLLLDAWMRRLAAFEPRPAPLEAHRGAVAGDLHACDALLPTPAEARPEAAPPGQPRSAAFLWGVSYVLEGSRLGGRVLYRRLAERLAPHPLNYLQGAGEQTGARWKDFVARLQAQRFGPDEVRSACEGAVDAFQLLLQCHRQTEPAR